MMNDFAICDRSALARWGEQGLMERIGPPLESPSDWSLPSAKALDDSVLRACRLEATPVRPLHVLVNSEARRIRSARVVSHIWSGPLPEGALLRLNPGVLIASPRFCLQQMAPRASLASIAAVGTEICGSYALSPRAEGGFHNRLPLDTPEGLAEHFAHERGFGSGRVREALPFVCPGSRSPMETVVVLFFTLPEEAGGCGLPAPQLNVRIEIPPDLQRALNVPYIVVDLCWPNQRVILEYDSYTWHLSSRRTYDSTQSRNEGLRDEGWTVGSVTAGILRSDAQRELLVKRVMSQFGRKPPSDEAFRLRQRLLVEELLAIR